jgi:hypothetical protein
MQSIRMDTNWAAEHLQTIRLLMERSALYRRALAPISIYVGCVGVAAALAGGALKVESPGRFAVYWLGVSIVATAGALLLVRRQAIKHGESFWSPPTRRVAQAMLPALVVGLAFGLLVAKWSSEFQEKYDAKIISLGLIIFWALLYGLALHAAGFFMPRGIRWFGWGIVLAGLILLGAMAWTKLSASGISPHAVMGIIFGGSHLAYGIYLYFTEQRKNEA